MRQIALKFLAEVNPTTPAFDAAPAGAELCFMPLEAVWPDDRLDTLRRRPKSEVSTGYVRFQEGDILCPKVTPTFQAGRSAIVKGIPYGVGAATTEVHTVRTRADRADPRFVRYALLSKRFLEEGVSRFQGVAGLQRVPADFLRDMQVVDLSLDEQRRIADFLNEEVSRCDVLARLRLEQKSRVETRFVNSVEELTSANRGSALRLKYILTESDRRACREVEPSELLSVSIHHGVVPRSSMTADLPRAQSLSNYKLVRSGDIVLNRMRAFQGGVGVARQDGVVSPDYAVLRCNPGADPNYLHYLLRAPWFVGEMTSRLRGIGSADQGNVRTPRVNVEDLLMTEVVLPQVREQQRIRAQLDELWEWTQTVSGRMKLSGGLLDERKRSLITAAVTGEFDLTSASSRAGGEALSPVGGV